MTQETCAGNVRVGSSANDFVQRLAQINNEAMLVSLRALQPWFDAYSRFFGSTMQGLACGCRIPETTCPPRCACTLGWTAVPGDQRRGHLTLTNTTKARLPFALAATPFRTCREVARERPQFEPAKGTLAPGESLLVQVSVATDASWRPGETYESEITVRGLYDRCVCLRVQVAGEPEPCCKIELGEIPRRIRADDWYRHFQCTEACFEPVRPSPNDPAGKPR